MNLNFISTSKTNQNIKLNCSIILKKPKNLKTFNTKIENGNKKFLYKIFIENSDLHLIIFQDKNLSNSLKYPNIGYFLFDIANKYDATVINIISDLNANIIDYVVYEFMQKDFIFNKYLKKSTFSKYKTSYKLSPKNKSKLDAILLLKQLVSEPSNIIYPQTFAEIVKRSINLRNTSVKILNKSKIEKLGLRCLLSVNQGSNKEPRVVEFLKKTPKNDVDILFVGKGVCFDSGGISLKPSAGMEDMKWDMAGAAVVSAVMKYLSNINTKFTYAGIIGLVENMPDGSAYKPGDIIKSYKGVNVEILNTDAEGRLVLADIISYGCDIYKPKIVIDFATLTGAVMIALGQHYAGLYSNDDKLANTLFSSGLDTNEKIWRMPLHEDFDKELNSPFVDLKNITNSRYGGSVTAAQFLKRFIPKDTKWAHLDIAGVTWKPNGDKMNGKGATGFGLTLISDFIDKYF